MFIGISGPTCSGKSTVCGYLTGRFPKIALVPLDNFFVDRQYYPMYEGFVNMDHPDGVRFELFIDMLRRLKKGEEVQAPVYDLAHSKIAGTTTVQLSEIMMFEGLFLFFRPEIRDMLDVKIYLDLPVAAQRNRRLERNLHSDPLYFDRVVVPMYERYLLGTKQHSDYIVNADRPIDAVATEITGILEYHFARAHNA